MLCQLPNNEELIKKSIILHQNELIFIKPQSEYKSTQYTTYFNGITWYNYMIPRDGVLTLMDSYTYEQLCNMFVVCLATPTSSNPNKPLHRFTAFENYSYFLEYIKSIPENFWSFFEVIMSDHKQKLYFDIDIKKENISANETLQQVSRELLNHLLLSIKACLLKYEIEVNVEKDILIFSSNADYKHSYHVILNNYYVTNNKLNASLSSQIRELIQSEYSKFIDEHVYSSKQQLRCYKSQKPGSGRVKELVNSTNESFETIFRNSSITYTTDCKPIPIYSTNNNNITSIDESQSTLTSTEIEEIKKKLPSVLFEIFKMKQIKGKLILLERIKSAHCSICDRIHENENAYLFINSKGEIHFRCRRDDNKSKYLGNLSKNHEADEIANKVLQRLISKK